MAKRHTLVNIYNNYLQDNLPNSINYVDKEKFKEINLLFLAQAIKNKNTINKYIG